jgi:hypothetical protein
MIGLGIKIEFSSVAEESNSQMRVFDTLGPMARAALNACPRSPDIKVFKQRFKSDFDRRFNGSRFGRRECNFEDPAIDAEFAAYIDSVVTERMGKPIEWHNLKSRRLQRGWRSRPIRLKDARSQT